MACRSDLSISLQSLFLSEQGILDHSLSLHSPPLTALSKQDLNVNESYVGLSYFQIRTIYLTLGQWYRHSEILRQLNSFIEDLSYFNPTPTRTKQRYGFLCGFTSALILTCANLTDTKVDTMDRLNCAARLMLVSDLDYTMVDHDDPGNGSLFSFNSLWESLYRHDSLLVFSTGRSPITYKELRNEKPLLTPDITVMSVGTEITYGESMVPDYEWERSLNHKWDRAIVTEETAKFHELVLQSEAEQRPHKVSFFVEKAKASQVINLLQGRLVARGLDVKIIYSGGVALDVLPRGAGKGQALAYLLKKFQVDDKRPINTLVCGDSGNDAELFSVPGVYGVMVNNAQEELLEWHAQNEINNKNILHASERCAGGIMQAIGHFDLGPSSSPRDAFDLPQCMKEHMNPGFEIVKFYLSCERWRRGDVNRSDDFVRNLKSNFHPSGIFVHPSGVQKHFDECLNELERSYGLEQGYKFWVWIDQMTSAQIGSDTWLVKFDKWELSGEKRHCCLTTVLLNSKAEGYTWMHIHQTWMSGYAGKSEGNLLF